MGFVNITDPINVANNAAKLLRQFRMTNKCKCGDEVRRSLSGFINTMEQAGYKYVDNSGQAGGVGGYFRIPGTSNPNSLPPPQGVNRELRRLSQQCSE